MKYYDPQLNTYYEPAAGYTPPASHILQPETSTTTPTTTVERPQGQGIEDFTRSLDTTNPYYKYSDSPTVYQASDNYAFTSGEDFLSKGGDWNKIETRQRTPQPPVGTSESERAKKRKN